MHHGWIITLTGRIDQVLPLPGGGQLLREIKTVTRAIPAPEDELRAEYPSYFAQLATYLSLRRTEAPEAPVRGELLFVEVGSGLSQTIALSPADEAQFTARLERVTEFLDLRWRARQRLRNLIFRPAFAKPRAGQETTRVELTDALEAHRIVAFEAPTGFGKTGVLVEAALEAMRAGKAERLIYLTGKATGQIQVQHTLAAMTGPAVGPASTAAADVSTPTRVAVWQVRNKGEHCVNHTFHCVREDCRFLADVEERWARSGLSRFYLQEDQSRDIATLRAAGREAGICPYEITRAALAFQDVWIGDYNYVFAPRNRGLFENQPGWSPASTLLVIDEAHNLPPRVADAYSHRFDATTATMVRAELQRARPPSALLMAWDAWTHFLTQLHPSEQLSPADEDDALHLISEIARHVSQTPLDPVALGPTGTDALWSLPGVIDDLNNKELPRLWWSPRPGELAITCLDAAAAIGGILRSYAGVVLASATLSPIDAFAAACGLATPPPVPMRTANAEVPDRLGKLTKRDTKKLFRQVSTGADLLRVEEERTAESLHLLEAHTPWREGAYDIAYDARVDTSYQQRERHYPTTARTIAALHRSASACIAVFFPSYAYAEAIRAVSAVSAEQDDALRINLQPRLPDLAAQAKWVEESLVQSEALFLVLGSSFAEGIDLLGGRVTHAMVVGPALPEVNASQRARLAEFMRAGLSRDAAVRRVYRIPGLQKVNQALGRLVRAPGQHARVLLHCRRFLDPAFASLLARDYQHGTTLTTDTDLSIWLQRQK